jgi:hypothetical protein
MTTRDDPLQAPHHIWIALQQSVVQCIYRCFGEDVLNKVIFGAGVGLLEFSDSVIIKLVLEIIMVEQATTLPFRLGRLDWLLCLLCIPSKRIRYLIPLTLLKCGLTRTPADGAPKTADARLNLFDRITLFHCQLNTPPAPDSSLVPKTVLGITVAPNLHLHRLEHTISSICFRSPA